MATEIDKKKNLHFMQAFTIKNIPDLDVCVLGALELFHSEKLPNINIKYKRPMIVGSGNAEAAGRIMFRDKDAVFASESDFEEKLKNIEHIDGVVLISASGAKHAPIIAETAKKHKKKVALITNTKNSPASKYADEEYILPKQKEPYTYNTSTYLGMILSHSKENPGKIYEFITNKIDKIKMPNFKEFDKYFIIIPSEFSGAKRMIQVKFIELFGRIIARDVETDEYVKHATTVVPSKELFIVFGENNKKYGEHQLNIPLPKNADYGAMISISYYIVGKIQKAHQPWFKENISEYADKASKIFGSKISPIVE